MEAFLKKTCLGFFKFQKFLSRKNLFKVESIIELNVWSWKKSNSKIQTVNHTVNLRNILTHGLDPSVTVITTKPTSIIAQSLSQIKILVLENCNCFEVKSPWKSLLVENTCHLKTCYEPWLIFSIQKLIFLLDEIYIINYYINSRNFQKLIIVFIIMKSLSNGWFQS